MATIAVSPCFFPMPCIALCSSFRSLFIFFLLPSHSFKSMSFCLYFGVALFILFMISRIIYLTLSADSNVHVRISHVDCICVLLCYVILYTMCMVYFNSCLSLYGCELTFNTWSKDILKKYDIRMSIKNCTYFASVFFFLVCIWRELDC